MIDVKGYVENEKYYIEKYDYDNCKKDLFYLESLTDEDIKKIQKLVEDDSELSNDIDNLVNEAIHWWVYHYKEKESEVV